MKNSISVVIPSFNSNKTIMTLIEKLYQESEFFSEVIIADSSDEEEHNTLRGMMQKYDKLFLKKLPYRTIPALARNEGAKEAKGNIIAFIDSDAYPGEHWLEIIQEAYSQGHRVGGGSICLPSFQQENRIAITQYYLQFNEYLPVGENREKVFSPSCNLFCDRGLFNEIGGFPDIRASEDVLFGMEANKYEPFLFLPDCKVHHVFGESWDRLKVNQKILGKYVGIYRKTKNPGVKYSIPVQLCLFPFIPLIKYFLLYKRVKEAGGEYHRQLKKGTSLILAGLWYWALGYMSGIFDRKEQLRSL